MIPIDKPFRTQEYKVAKARISELDAPAYSNTSSLSQINNTLLIEKSLLSYRTKHNLDNYYIS